MEPIFGSVIVEVLGAGVKWAFLSIRSSILGRSSPSFKKIYLGKEKRGSAEYLYGGMSNIGLGAVTLVILLGLFLEFSKYFR